MTKKLNISGYENVVLHENNEERIMKPEVKAAQLAEYYYPYDISKDNCEHYDLYNAALKMHKWTKEQITDKACEFFYNKLNGGDMECGDIEKFIEDFKNAVI